LSDNSISICNINIRSIRNKINFLQNFVDEFDIIVLTETHLDNSIENRDIELDSFDKNPQRKDRTNSGGGLLIYSKEDIGICRKHELENDIDETIWVEVSLVGFSITFLKLKSLIISINLLLFKDIRSEFSSPEITIFSLT
jgi:hypothetical protein